MNSDIFEPLRHALGGFLSPFFKEVHTMHLSHYDYETVIANADGTKGCRADIIASNAPSQFPTTAEGMTGKFPTRNAADTQFLPGSTLYATKTGTLFMLNSDGDWDQQ